MENEVRFASASVSDRGLSEKRPVNEDSFLELSELGLFAVADGVGGAQAGDVASQMAMETLEEAFRNLPEHFDAEQALRISLEHANHSIYSMANELPQLASMATTVAAVHLKGNIATVAHVGDSRVYRIEPDGALKRETADHSVVEEAVRAGQLTPEQAATHPNRNVISRALGADETVDVEIRTLMVEPGTMFLLCSDGITRHIPDDEIEELFGNEIEPGALCESMRELCYSRGAEDNLTAVIVRLPTALGSDLGSSLTSSSRNGEGPVVEEPTVPEPEPEPEEEETITTARSPFDTYADESLSAEVSAAATSESNVPTESKEFDDEAYLMDVSDESREEVEENPREESVAAGAPKAVSSPPDVKSEPDRIPYNFQTYQDDKPGVLGKVFTALLFLALGAGVGAGGYYLLLRSEPVPQVPVLNETKSSNIPLTTYEETRRNVDAAPDRYLAQFAPTPDDAIDHYFLARALLLTGKAVEAKRQIALARGRLGELPPEASRSLATDLALASAVADNPLAAEAFTKESTTQATNTNANANVNGSNAPIR